MPNNIVHSWASPHSSQIPDKCLVESKQYQRILHITCYASAQFDSLSNHTWASIVGRPIIASINIKEAQAQNVVVPLGSNDLRGFRLEIDEFLADDYMSNLYILALEAMQKEDITKSQKNISEDW